MEHILLAHGGKLTEHDRVPYCARNDYQGVPFLDYLDQSNSRNTWNYLADATAEDANALLQTWLFFGLLQELLGSHFHHDDYICRELQPDGSTKTFVTTARLIANLEAWAEHCTNSPNDAGSVEHLENCLDETYAWPTRAPNVNRAVRISIRSVACTVAAVVTRFHDAPYLHLASSIPDIDEQDLTIMVQAGWCPAQAARAWRSFRSIDAQMLLRTWCPDQAKPGQNHMLCTRDSFRCATINMDNFSLVHVRNECSCKPFSVSTDQVTAILQSGRTPLLEIYHDHQFRQAEAPSLRLVASSPGIKYVAISHVWADGLGNPYANSLPTCQITSLISKVQRLSYTSAESDDIPPTYIWLDVLCCPVSPAEAKSLAIQHMKRTYREADQVLVIDSHLECIESKAIKFLDIACQILASRWVSRLWTLQEAILPPRLLFLFKDTILDADRFMEEFAARYRNSPLNHDTALADFSVRFDVLRPLQMQARRRTYGIYKIIQSVLHRSVSVATDEPLCLATLIGEDVPFIEDYVGQNMARFWKLCAQRPWVYADIIFNDVPKLDVKGFGWAPSTLLYSKHGILRGHDPANVQIDRFGVASGQLPALDEAGLMVKFGGFTLKAFPGSPASCQDVLARCANQLEYRFFFFRDAETGQWTTVKLRWKEEGRDSAGLSTDSKLAFILDPTTEDEYTARLGNLCWVVSESHVSIQVRTLGPCVVWPHDAAFSSMFDEMMATTSESAQSRVESVKQYVNERGYFDETLDTHGLAKRNRDHDPMVVDRYAEMIQSRTAEKHILLLDRHLDEQQQWIVD